MYHNSFGVLKLIKNLHGKAIECLPLVHTYAEAEEVNSKWGGGPLVLYESGGGRNIKT